MKAFVTVLFIGWTFVMNAQIVNAPPYTFSIDDFKNWTPDGPLADDALIATEPLRPRFVNTDTQFVTDLSNEMEIAYLPDGMSNFANYSEEQSQFNLYNFTNWSYIDKMVWFGGTSVDTFSLPSAPWVNAGHKNGVKTFANVFFAPVVFGGSTETLTNFLEQNNDGSFVLIPVMIAAMQHYNFDGWFINQETDTNAETALLMREFMEDLTTEVEALGKEVMWYDSMLLSGNVSWQNRLNTNNSVFVQDDADGNSGNGFEERVSSSIFINFFWAGSAGPNASRVRAGQIGRSEFDVFTGVDLWPGRNQSRFQTGGNTWMGALQQSVTTPITSLGLFVPNMVFNNAEYSTFNENPDDYENFYSEERHMFAGADRNPRLEDASGFKGYANWLPAASTITEMPFETNFNTGHGLGKWEEGVQVSTDAWHNMNDQDILPNWQFAFSEDDMLQGSWDFDTAYNGGSSLRIEGSLNANDPIDLLLYKTQIPLTADSKIDIIYNQSDSENAQMMVLVDFVDTSLPTAEFFITPTTDDLWEDTTFFLSDYAGEEIATIGLKFLSGESITNYGVSIGNIRVHEGEALSVKKNSLSQNGFSIYQNSDDIVLDIKWSSAPKITFSLLSLDGKLITQNQIDIAQKVNFNFSTSNLASGVYLVSLSDDKQVVTKKLVIQ
jgi:endo-beta-N-acetylglucosaminidase D